MSNISYYTKEGLQKLKDRLHNLRTAGRTEIAQQIAEAREKGDLRENAEYDAAKDAQGMLELNIAKLEAIVANARIVDESKIDTSKVTILSTVTIKHLAMNKTFKYMLVSEEEADLKQGRISVQSPIGKALLGHEKGAVVEVVAPAGTNKFEILEISHG
ncbi:MAG: transcription elongation factor GreA [Cytophagales bacterium]|nr:MAG: transcription elongation factor GreA [Cytophagales bacterium]TAF61639.1 MAG: transcription elongation factor GreA [Cytophagales bacterium]